MFQLGYILIKHISKRRVNPLQNTLYQELSILNGNLAHNFMIFHLEFAPCLLNVVKTVITENNENIDIIHIYREMKI